MASPSGTRAAIFAEVDVERNLQDLKWGGVPGIDRRDDHTYAAVLGEELGEVCKAWLERDVAGLREELVQVTAVAIAWIEELDNGGGVPRTDDHSWADKPTEFWGGDPAVVRPSDSLAESQAGSNGLSGSPNSPPQRDPVVSPADTIRRLLYVVQDFLRVEYPRGTGHPADAEAARLMAALIRARTAFPALLAVGERDRQHIAQLTDALERIAATEPDFGLADDWRAAYSGALTIARAVLADKEDAHNG